MRKTKPRLRNDHEVTQKLVYESTSCSTAEGKFTVVSLPKFSAENHELNARIDERIRQLRSMLP